MTTAEPCFADMDCREWTERDCVCKPEHFPQVPLSALNLWYSRQGKDVTPTKSTCKLNEFWQQSWQFSLAAARDDRLHLLICSAILPRKQQQLPASWFIPPPYVQLSVCMTIKNKATYIMALKHVTNQLCPLSYYNIQNAWASTVCREGQTQPDHTGDWVVQGFGNWI